MYENQSRKFWESLIKDEATLRELTEASVVITVQKNEILLREQEMNDHVYFLIRGLFNGFYLLENGKSAVDQICCRCGDVLNTMMELKPVTRQLLTRKALEDSVVLKISMALVCEIINRNAEVMDVYIRLLHKDLEEFSEINTMYANCNASQRWEWFQEKYPDLVGRMKKKDIAAFLHITPNSFSKIRAKQKKD